MSKLGFDTPGDHLDVVIRVRQKLTYTPRTQQNVDDCFTGQRSGFLELQDNVRQRVGLFEYLAAGPKNRTFRLTSGELQPCACDLDTDRMNLWGFLDSCHTSSNQVSTI